MKPLVKFQGLGFIKRRSNTWGLVLFTGKPLHWQYSLQNFFRVRVKARILVAIIEGIVGTVSQFIECTFKGLDRLKRILYASRWVLVKLHTLIKNNWAYFWPLLFRSGGVSLNSVVILHIMRELLHQDFTTLVGYAVRDWSNIWDSICTCVLCEHEVAYDDAKGWIIILCTGIWFRLHIWPCFMYRNCSFSDLLQALSLSHSLSHTYPHIPTHGHTHLQICIHYCSLQSLIVWTVVAVGVCKREWACLLPLECKQNRENFMLRIFLCSPKCP